MSTSTHERIPAFTRGDRLRIARVRNTGLGVREFAALIGVSTSTVTSAELDKREVRKITLNAWSLVTGVPVEWLETGVEPATDPDPSDGVIVQYVPALRVA